MPGLMDLDSFIHYALRPSICYPCFVCYSFIVWVNIVPYMFYLYLCSVRCCYLSYLHLFFSIPIMFSSVIYFCLFFSKFICCLEYVCFFDKNGSRGNFLTCYAWNGFRLNHFNTINFSKMVIIGPMLYDISLINT